MDNTMMNVDITLRMKESGMSVSIGMTLLTSMCDEGAILSCAM